MKNVSRNGFQAVVIRPGSCLGHKALPSFSLESGKPFTVEVRFAYTKGGDGILYAQDGGITIGLQEELPYVKHPALGSLYSTNARKTHSNGLMMISVTFDGSKLSMQLNGIEVISQGGQRIVGALFRRLRDRQEL